MTVGALAQMLRQEGVRVEYEPPQERRDLAGMRDAVVVGLIVEGALRVIKAAVGKFRERFPRAEVQIDDDEDDD